MRDEELELFIEEMGEPTSIKKVSYEELEAYRGVLPNKLLEYWQEVGWSSFANGLVWLVNPALYDDLLEQWIVDTAFEKIDRYHVFARTAYGTLYVIGEKTGRSFTIHCPSHFIVAQKNSIKRVQKDPDLTIQSFFAMADKNEFDIEDINDSSLFDQALIKLGPLKENEVYGFEPSLALGGGPRVECVAKLDLNIHLQILRQLSAPILPF
ncbi:hypothetical protein MACH09_41030 [Vibrio sp. MACH09]|uniref:GAD-like domain-containing protein n=1 Tax=Vibrio sp. MACH09 TaxID=3025122 RepID=UPI00278D3D2E|nr:GAD-like domain-containing protein [Vibrio sp. MACH09]GLO63595.1 hypothetical protein MACH09_41030 [Vibrio sp. MACH09]